MDKEIITEKLKFYKIEGTTLHLTLSTDKKKLDGSPAKRWANGKVVGIKSTHFVLDEEKLGKMIVFFKEVIEVEPRKERDSYYGYGIGEGVDKEEFQKGGEAYGHTKQ